MATKGKRLRALILLAGGFVFLIVVLLGGILTYQFLKYKNAGLDGLQKAPQAFVSITSPQSFSQMSEGSPLPVSVSSNGYQPIVAIELWVDGILMGVQAAPPGGLFNFDTTFLWSPGPAGEHSLVARALDANGDVVVSLPVLINIKAFVPPEGTQSSTPFDPGPASVLPVASGGGSAPSGNMPVPNESESPAQVGLPSLSDWVIDITNTEPPPAPGLTSTMDGCIVTLHIHDLSQNEEGFQIFRSVPSTPAWTEIVALNSQSATEWITYADEQTEPVEVSYYVAAVNSVGQAKSNPVTVTLTSAGCPAAESSQEILIIKPVSFHIDAAIDQAYCYKSLGGVHWDRWPSDSFFLPGADGFDIQPYQMSFALNGLNGEALIKKLDLYIECWGWASGELVYLGEVHFGSTDLFDLGEQTRQSGIFTMGLEFVVDFFDSSPQFDIIVPPPISAEMPFIYAHLTYNQFSCRDHLPDELQNAWGALMFCTPFPDYTLGPGTENPQPYLVWSVEDECTNDFSGVACQSMASLLDIAEANDGNVFFSIYDQNDYIDHFTFNPAGITSHIVTPLKCNGTRTYTVKLIYSDSVNYVEGPESNEVSIPCLITPLVTQAELDVTFDTLTLSNVDDGESDPDQVEVYGLFLAASFDGSGGGRTLAERDYVFANNCPGDIVQFGGYLDPGGLGNPGCPGYYENGSYSISSLPLCTSDHTDYCYVEGDNSQTEFSSPNNTIHLTVGDGDSILLQVMLIDWDDISGDDVVCFVTIITSSNTAQGWASSTVPFVLSQGNNGHAACNVQGTISATP